jgi:hypothetical protein
MRLISLAWAAKLGYFSSNRFNHFLAIFLRPLLVFRHTKGKFVLRNESINQQKIKK